MRAEEVEGGRVYIQKKGTKMPIQQREGMNQGTR